MVSKNSKVGQWENLFGRSNQQETRVTQGSSETLCGTFIFSNFQESSVKHKKLSSSQKQFLEWFLGFVEGDGSFGIQENRPVFVINQAEIEILQKIRAQLGFGVVYTYEQQGRIYARYLVKKKEGILCLIQLFNGNIYLQKVHDRFTLWVNKYNEMIFDNSEKIEILPKRFPTELSLENAWLSGFFAAEGGFYAGLSQQNTKSKTFRLRLNAYVDQKNEFDIMLQIAFLFDVANVTTRSVEKKTYRVECTTKKSLKNVFLYFEKYNLHSKKHIVYAMWRKIVFSYLENLHFENFEQLERRIARIQKQNRIFKESKTCLPK